MSSTMPKLHCSSVLMPHPWSYSQSLATRQSWTLRVCSLRQRFQVCQGLLVPCSSCAHVLQVPYLSRFAWIDLQGGASGRPAMSKQICIAGTRLRRDLLTHGDVGALEGTNAALSAARSQHSGITEQFAFARAVSRLFELTQGKARHT